VNLNKVYLVGRLTNDPEQRSLPSGQPVASFSLATNRFWKDQSGTRQEDTQFHNVVLFGKLAELATQYLAKGRLALVEGRIQTRSWEDQSGQRKYRTEIIAESLQFGPRTGGESAPPQEKKAADKPAKEEEIPVIEQEVDTSDIPF
jgi:single-strand DNA-binding protein